MPTLYQLGYIAGHDAKNLAQRMVESSPLQRAGVRHTTDSPTGGMGSLLY